MHVAKRPTLNGTFSCCRVLEGELIALIFLLKHHRLTDMGLLFSFPSLRVQIRRVISRIPLFSFVFIIFVCNLSQDVLVM